MATHAALPLLALLLARRSTSAAAAVAPVQSGAQRLVAGEYAELRGQRVGIVANPTTLLPDLSHLVDAMAASPHVDVVAVFGPEHGFRGDHQAGHGGADHYTDNRTGLPVYSTYGKEGAQLSALLREAGIDCVVFDIQDVGTRFYTYIWTMYDVLSACPAAGVKRFYVLDRPNPLGGLAVQGPVLEPAFASFIGRLPIPLRHGMTVGELARLFNAEHMPQPGAVNVSVVRMSGWQRGMMFPDTGLPWIMPSPNMPTWETAMIYPGTGLIEGTNMSEGRGTTRPFEVVGAPYLTWEFAAALQA